jgi:hypothetical protein
LSLVRACSSGDSVSLYQQTWETSSLLWVSVIWALSAGMLSSCSQGAQISGFQTCLLSEDEGPKQGLFQKLCSFCSRHSHLHNIVFERSWTRNGSPRCSGKTLPGGADTFPLAGNVPRCLESETGSAPEAVWLLPVPEAVSFPSPHSHLHRLVSEGSGNQAISPRCSGLFYILCYTLLYYIIFP